MVTNYDFGNVSVTTPSTDESGWYVTEQQSFTIDKGEFMLKEFAKDFPKFKVNDYDVLQRVVGRSTKLQEWFQKTSLLYADSIQLPVSFKELFSPKDYNRFYKDILSYKTVLAQESAEIEELSKKFSTDLKEIKKKYKDKTDKIIGKEKVYSILSMNSSDMPISLQIEIEGYTPVTGDVTQKRRMYGREMLLKYQRSLIKLVNDDPLVDIDAIIEENRVK